ncbi:hypothetical protein JNUCC31_08265 [Paenibacillus sp. JNUCC31]|uniref:hypothetical protein n=1 Tax=Paenibacillus sp. JNUCC-31 TaxID=2777983 RepID=UPI00177BD6D1|nr:hypothetical protein [Paenibacillus sp. JNUCC-31]QOS80853.1 hypothetical protein JNUCC31_08265 [Paenibacillus sp. JNUCC-31]
MDFEEMKQRVEMGEEFQFYYKLDSYWISHNQAGFYLTRVKDSYSQFFKTSNELFKDAQIEGKKLLELWNELDI